MQYDLPELTRKTNTRRKSIVLRPIEVIRTQEKDLESIILQVVRSWQTALTDLVLPLYSEGVEQLTRVQDAASDSVKHALDQAALAAERAQVATEPQITAWLTRFDAWHAKQWAAGVKAGTGVDVFPFVDVKANAEGIIAAQRRYSSLIKGLNDDLRKQVEETVWQGFLDKTPRKQMGKLLGQRIGVARSRANLIASDQANKTSSYLTMVRQQEAGIEQFVWETAKDDRVRPEHQALQGKLFSWDKPPYIGLPGTPIRCRCTGRAYIPVDEEVETPVRASLDPVAVREVDELDTELGVTTKRTTATLDWSNINRDKRKNLGYAELIGQRETNSPFSGSYDRKSTKEGRRLRDKVSLVLNGEVKEIGGLKDYAGTRNFIKIQTQLRTGIESSPKITKQIEKIDKSLSGVQLRVDTIAYRGVEQNMPLEVGLEWVDKGYTSSSLDFGGAFYGRRILRFHFKQGDRVLFLRDDMRTGWVHELEMLLPRGSRFKITSKTTEDFDFGHGDRQSKGVEVYEVDVEIPPAE